MGAVGVCEQRTRVDASVLYCILGASKIRADCRGRGEEGYTLLYHVLETCIPLYHFGYARCICYITKLATQSSSRVLSEPC